MDLLSFQQIVPIFGLNVHNNIATNLVYMNAWLLVKKKEKNIEIKMKKKMKRKEKKNVQKKWLNVVGYRGVEAELKKNKYGTTRLGYRHIVRTFRCVWKHFEALFGPK